jgi:hypothetical protein
MGILSSIFDPQKADLRRQLNYARQMKAAGKPGWDKNIATLEARLNPTSKIITTPLTPIGGYGWNSSQDDQKRADQGSDALIQQVNIPVGVVGLISAFNPFYCKADGMQLIARTIDDNGNVIESSDSARIYVKINLPGAMWLPVSFNLMAAGQQKGDAFIFQGTIRKFWVYVHEITQDSVNQPYLIIALLRRVGIFAGLGGGSLYGSPSGSGGQPTSTPVATGGQSVSGAPGGGGAAPGGTAPGGTSPTGGGGTYGGGGNLPNMPRGFQNT